MPGATDLGLMPDSAMSETSQAASIGTRSITPPVNRGSAACMTRYRTVANWGRVCLVTICAMMLPPNAGRVCTSSQPSRMSRPVQSAVRPVLRRTATRGARLRPTLVAPTSTAAGMTRRAQSSNTLA